MDQGNESSSTVGTTTINNNKYLAMLPRGLQKPIIESVSKSLLVTRNSTESSSSSTSFTILNNEDYDGTILKRGLAKLNEKIEKRKNRNSTTSSNNNTSKRKNNKICNENWCQCPVGTIPLEQKFHISIGYTADGESSYTCPGQISGSIWLQITTKQKQLVTSRCIGPLMSLIHVAKIISNDNNNNNNDFSNIQTVVKNIGSTIIQNNNNQQSYRQEFDNALRLWKEHVTTVWKEQINDDEYYTSLQRRIKMNQLRYRFSCVRENSNVPYSRQELLQELLDQFGTELVPYQDHQWKVDLTNFDIEIVLIVLSNGRIALGISLQPYSYHKSRSFDMGSVPPDVTPPYIGGNLLSGVVRLRPTTARIMLELATIKPYELVIDPCCGIGTIPVECEQYLTDANNNSTTRAVSIGGDIVLDHDTMSSAAIALEQVANHGHHNHHHHKKQQQQQQQSSSSSSSPSSSFSQLSVAWDAAYLPLRTGVVDAVVSDLPFGKMCLSSSTLEKLLPLIMYECARVLIPGRGRMVLLCGSPDALFRALSVHSMYWKQPCTMIAPVNIGGLLAWMCRVERSNVKFIVTTDGNNDDDNTTTTTTKGENKSSKELIRAMTKKRDVRRYHDSKKRRVQSKS